MAGPLRMAALGAAALVLCGAAAPAWDVADTGQPTTTAEFSVTEGTWMSLDVSPDGRTIVFDLLGDIYAIPATGGEARLVHGGPAMQRSPRFSPDGTRLLYLSDRSGSDNLWTSAPDGSDARQVTHETTDLLTGPAWGPKGAFVAAAKMESTVARLHASEIRLYDLGGGSGRVLVAAPANTENVHEAQFSSDGRYVYYTEKVTGPSASRVYIDANHANYAIRRRDLATGEVEELVRGFGGATTPAISRDDRRLAFVRRVKDKTVLFVLDLATREQRPVFDGLDRDAQADFIGQGLYYPQYAWFPDNRHIAIWAKGKLKKVDVETGTAVEIPFRANVRQQLTTPARVAHDLAPERFTVKAVRHLAISPDGRTAVFNGLGQLWAKPLAGGKPQRVAASALAQSEPSFSPDGKQIAYAEWSDEAGGSLRVAEAGRSRLAASSKGPVREPRFSPDGQMLLYKIDQGDSCLGGHEARPGLYLAPVSGGESRWIAEPGGAPMFSPDGRRIWFTRETYAGEDLITTLESVDLNGQDRREHARTRGADTSELRISPDLRWIAFRDRQQYYVTSFRETGRPFAVGADERTAPVIRLSEGGGYNLVWSADSSTVYWTLGETIQAAKVGPGGASPIPPTRIGLEAAGDRPDGVLALVGARIITMQGDRVIERGTVIVRGNRIEAVGAAGEVAMPSGAKVIDVAGKTIMPGLVDMHGHIDNCYYTSAGVLPQKQSTRYADLAYGVTTNYDPYSSELPTYAMSEMTTAGVMVGPRAIDSGLVAYGRTGKVDSVYLPIRTLDDARTLMARKVALGGLTVKSYRQPMRSQRQMLIRAGREAGVMLDVEGESHFFNNLTMITDGHFNLQHNMPVATYYDDVVQLMAHGQVSHTPTLIMLFGELIGENYLYQTTRMWEDPKARAYVQVVTSGYSPLGTPYGGPPHARGMTTIQATDELWDIGFRSVARSMKKLDDAGVTVNAGSHGQVAGLAMHWEMWLLAEGGMSNLHVLRAGTLNGARTLGLDRQIGSVEPGKLADMLVLDANPLDDIRNTNTVRYTMVNGRLYDSLGMDEIGLRSRPRGKFYWEVGRDYRGIEWERPWAHH
jgi:Tol biopolymer transport system component